MTNEKNYRINVRVTESQFKWYNDEAQYRKIKLSEFLRIIPNIFKEWEELFAIKGDIIMNLEKKIKKLKNGYENKG